MKHIFSHPKVHILLTLLMMVFIFLQSALPGHVSGAESNLIVRVLSGLLDAAGVLCGVVVMPDIVIDKKVRLYEACNIINSKSFLKATLDHSEVRFSYEIPSENVTEGLRSIVANVLYCYENEIDVDLFRVAIQTEEDFYAYYNKKMEAEFRSSCKKNIHNPGFHLGEVIPEEDKPVFR